MFAFYYTEIYDKKITIYKYIHLYIYNSLQINFDK